MASSTLVFSPYLNSSNPPSTPPRRLKRTISSTSVLGIRNDTPSPLDGPRKLKRSRVQACLCVGKENIPPHRLLTKRLNSGLRRVARTLKKNSLPVLSTPPPYRDLVTEALEVSSPSGPSSHSTSEEDDQSEDILSRRVFERTVSTPMAEAGSISSAKLEV